MAGRTVRLILQILSDVTRSCYGLQEREQFAMRAKVLLNLTDRLIEAINGMLTYDKNIKIMIETKPNEPVDRSVCPTLGQRNGNLSRQRLTRIA